MLCYKERITCVQLYKIPLNHPFLSRKSRPSSSVTCIASRCTKWTKHKLHFVLNNERSVFNCCLINHPSDLDRLPKRTSTPQDIGYSSRARLVQKPKSNKDRHWLKSVGVVVFGAVNLKEKEYLQVFGTRTLEFKISYMECYVNIFHIFLIMYCCECRIQDKNNSRIHPMFVGKISTLCLLQNYTLTVSN